MKFQLSILSLAIVATAHYEQVCVEKIPEGADASKYNLCRENPLGYNLPVVTHAVQQRTQTPEEIAAECGSLGVMIVPPGEDPSKYRKCREHPFYGKNAGPGIDST